jgi:hypothetical protein
VKRAKRTIGALRAGRLMAELDLKFYRERVLAEYKHLPIRQVKELPTGPRPREIPGMFTDLYACDSYMKRSERRGRSRRKKGAV